MKRPLIVIGFTGLLALACAPAASPRSAPPTRATTPAPSAGPTPGARTGEPSPTNLALAPLPAALEHFWVGETRAIPGLEPAAVESIMKYENNRLVFYPNDNWDQPIVTSDAKVDAAGNMRLVLDSASVGCSAGTVGTYDFALSSSGRALVLAAIDDPCGPRAAAIAGAWTLSACPDNHLCLGDLDAGEHASVIYTPFVPYGEHTYEYGRFAYTVPDGWTNAEDNADGYVLLPLAAPDGTGIYVFSDVLAHEQELDPVTHHCVGEPALGVGSSAVEIHNWIESLDGLLVTHDRADVEIGGLTGFSMDLVVDPAWDGTCGWPNEIPGVQLFVNKQSSPEEGLDWGINGDTRMRLFVLDLGPGRTLLVDIEAPDEATNLAYLPQAMTIVESFQFRH